MGIAVLGWGSLCWCPRKLRINGGWKTDGPLLPIEFGRISESRHDCLTLVLFPRSRRVQVLWAEMSFGALDEAIENLREQEGTTENRIGWVDLHHPSNNNCKAFRTGLDIIKRWGRRKHLDAVVWTDLPSNFRKKTKTAFNKDNLIDYIRTLRNDSRTEAERYVRRAPAQIRTKMRDIIEETFDWTNASLS